jgi:hypothetical protein
VPPRFKGLRHGGSAVAMSYYGGRDIELIGKDYQRNSPANRNSDGTAVKF